MLRFVFQLKNNKMIKKHIFLLLIILISATVCNGKKSSKLVGGTPVDIESYPFQVSLQQSSHHICSGSIISMFYILTVASCVILKEGLFMGNLKILSGTEDRYNAQGFGQIHDVSLIIHHPDYDQQNFYNNDIALLKLEAPIMYSQTRKRIAISRNFYRGIRPVHMTSWGDGFFLLSSPVRYLSKADMVVEQHLKCNSIFGGFISKLYSSQSCASLKNKRQMITWGDGGSPLTLDEEIIGIVSVHGPKIPHALVFTRMFFMNEWIKKVLREY